MNIFYLDKNPQLAAQYHVDDHFKMILESGQLLSTAIRVMIGKPTKLTAPNGKNKIVYLLDGETYTWESKVKKGKVVYSFVSDMGLYVQTHINHPSAVWVRECFANFKYTYDLMMELNAERCYRKDTSTWHKTATQMHKAGTIEWGIVAFNFDLKDKLPGDVTPPALVMPDHCKISDDPVECYRYCYGTEKQDLHQWTKRGAPSWL